MTMEKRNYSITANTWVAPQVYRLELAAPDAPPFRAGQFVEVAVPGKYLRRPISVSFSDKGRLILLYKVVGEGTRALASLPAGAELELLTSLGNGFDLDACRENALLIGGGIAPAVPRPAGQRAEGDGPAWLQHGLGCLAAPRIGGTRSHGTHRNPGRVCRYRRVDNRCPAANPAGFRCFLCLWPDADDAGALSVAARCGGVLTGGAHGLRDRPLFRLHSTNNRRSAPHLP